MKLLDLIDTTELYDPECQVSSDIEVENICSDSRNVESGSLFFCILGSEFDARVFVNEAFAKGAVAVIHEGELQNEMDGLTIRVKNARHALSYAANKFFGQPSHSTRNIAITGTSGKTSVAWILSHAFHILGDRSFLGGTLGFKLLESGEHATKGIKELTNTTMDPISVHSALAGALKSGAKVATFEATSQGVLHKRMHHVAWDGAIFTNLSRDHMDLHGDMQRYEAAKRLLFLDDLAKSPKQSRFAVFNFDDEAGRRIAFELKAMHDAIEVVTFGREKSHSPDFLIEDLSADPMGLSFTLRSKNAQIEISSPLVGTHNTENLSSAALALLRSGVDAKVISKVLSEVPPVPGRLEPVHGKGRSIYVDYAHKPDALEKVLEFLKPLATGRLISVFGCGGDRDEGKRPVMGEISRRLADVSVVTSDNPRTEDPNQIIDQIVSGIPRREEYSLVVEVDRRKAIAEAIRLAEPGDIVLIAGKGHEPYQEILGVKHPFHDVEVAREVLSSLE